MNKKATFFTLLLDTIATIGLAVVIFGGVARPYSRLADSLEVAIPFPWIFNHAVMWWFVGLGCFWGALFLHKTLGNTKSLKSWKGMVKLIKILALFATALAPALIVLNTMIDELWVMFAPCLNGHMCWLEIEAINKAINAPHFPIKLKKTFWFLVLNGVINFPIASYIQNEIQLSGRGSHATRFKIYVRELVKESLGIIDTLSAIFIGIWTPLVLFLGFWLALDLKWFIIDATALGEQGWIIQLVDFARHWALRLLVPIAVSLLLHKAYDWQYRMETAADSLTWKGFSGAAKLVALTALLLSCIPIVQALYAPTRVIWGGSFNGTHMSRMLYPDILVGPAIFWLAYQVPGWREDLRERGEFIIRTLLPATFVVAAAAVFVTVIITWFFGRAYVVVSLLWYVLTCDTLSTDEIVKATALKAVVSSIYIIGVSMGASFAWKYVMPKLFNDRKRRADHKRRMGQTASPKLSERHDRR